MVLGVYRTLGRVLAVPAAILFGLGNTVALAAERTGVPQRKVVVESPEGARPPAPGDLADPAKVAQYRAALIEASTHSNARRAKLAKRTLLWLEIATAKTPAERRAWVSQLAVFQAADGRMGPALSDIVGGKARPQRVIPAVSVRATVAPRGPAAHRDLSR